MKKNLSPRTASFLFAVTTLLLLACSGAQKKIDAKRQEATLKEQLSAATKNFFRLLEEKNIPKWIDLWAEDGIDRKPYATGMFPEEYAGKTAVYGAWKGVGEAFDSVSFPIHELVIDEESRTVVARLDGRGVMKNGYVYQNTYIFLFHYNDELKIKEIYEYFNPYLAGKALGRLDALKY